MPRPSAQAQPGSTKTLPASSGQNIPDPTPRRLHGIGGQRRLPLCRASKPIATRSSDQLAILHSSCSVPFQLSAELKLAGLSVTLEPAVRGSDRCGPGDGQSGPRCELQGPDDSWDGFEWSQLPDLYWNQSPRSTRTSAEVKLCFTATIQFAFLSVH